MKRWRRILLILPLVLLAVIALIIVVLWLIPMGSLPAPAPNPAADYADAMARIAEVQARDTEAIHPLCQTRVLTHETRTRFAIALLHGITNCPEQWRVFADRLFEAGYNVYIPRIPNNGYADRTSEEAAKIRADDLVQLGAETSDILHGLGDETIIMGLSGGGVIATWAAAARTDLDRVFIIAPSYVPYDVPVWFAVPFTNYARFSPNRAIWWDEDRQEDQLNMPYAAPLIYSRGAGEVLRLTRLVLAQAESAAPSMPVTFVLNESDTAINPEAVEQLVVQWRANGADVAVTTIPGELGVDHDIIDPHQPTQRIDVIYPLLTDLLEEQP
jgi:pimeloyl-ACP methyl ester carboxylesterase